MKPPPFEYRAPETLDEAVALLAADPGARPIAGGQSLMPVLNFRLATPSLLVDLRRVSGLGDVAIGADGVRLGAKVRWRDIEDDARLQSAHPLLRAAVRMSRITRSATAARSAVASRMPTRPRNCRALPLPARRRSKLSARRASGRSRPPSFSLGR